MKPIPEHIYCPRCGSKSIWNDGSVYGEKNYECKECHKNFFERALNPFYRCFFPQNVIVFAIKQVYNIPASYAGVARLLGDMGIKTTRKQVRIWCLKFGKFLDISPIRAPIKYGRVWHIDEMYVKINGRKGWLFEVVDDKGNTLSFWFSYRKDKNAAEKALQIAEKRVGFKPDRIVRDGAKSYDAIAKRKSWRDIPHTKAHFLGKEAFVRGKLMLLSNNRVEGHHSLTRMHLGLRRGEKNIEGTNLFLTGKAFFQNAARVKRRSLSYRLQIPQFVFAW